MVRLATLSMNDSSLNLNKLSRHFLGWEFFMGKERNVKRDFLGMSGTICSNVRGIIQVEIVWDGCLDPLQDYKSLHVVVVIWANLVNRHTETYRQLFNSYIQHKLSQPSLKKLQHNINQK